MGRAYLDWAQYPTTETEALQPPQEGYIVRFQDLRYVQMPSAFDRRQGHRTLGAAVELDKNLRVVGDIFGAGNDQVVLPEPGQH